MMTLDEFHRAQENNTKIINDLLSGGSLDGLKGIQFWEKPAKVETFLLLQKINDILGCCAIGAIPSIKPTGADGYVYFKENDTPVEVETKMTAIRDDYIVIGPKGGIQYSTPTMFERRTKPTGITSKIGGSFDARMSQKTLKTKARHTALVCFDFGKNELIDAWMLDGNTVYAELLRRHRPDMTSLRISLATFRNKGWNIPVPIDKLGWSDWKEHIQLTCADKVV